MNQELTYFYLISFICGGLVFFTFKEILLDTLNNKISIITLPTIFLPIFFNYILTIFYIPGCLISNYCLSPYPEIESKLFYKASLLFITFFIGLIISLKAYKSNKFNFLKTVLNKIPKRRLILPYPLSLGIFCTFIISSFVFIIWGLISGNQYYNPTYQKLFNYYVYFLLPPVLLIEIVTDRVKDLKLLSICLALYSFVLFFGLGRTQNSIFVFTFSILVFFIASYPNLKGPFKIKKLFRNKIFLTLIILFLSFFIIIVRLKYSELERGIEEISSWNSIYTGKLSSCLLDNSCRQLIYTSTAVIIGNPVLTIAHMINSIDYPSVNVINYQIIQLLIIPFVGSKIVPTDLIYWYTHLPAIVLNLEITEFGGSTFGSEIGMYSYFNLVPTITLILLLSALNIFIIYFLGSKVSMIISRYYANNTQNSISVRPYIYFLMSMIATSYIPSGFIHSILIYIPFWFISKIFTKSKVKFF